MPRFLLIDHSIVDWSGHHLEYALHVLRAVERTAFVPLLATNRRFALAHETPCDVARSYRFGFWFHQGSPDLHRGVSRLRSGWSGLRRVLARPSAASDGQPTVGHSGWLRRIGQALYDDLRRRQFALDTRQSLDKLGLTHGDVVFVPTLSEVELAGLLALWQSRRPAPRVWWHLLFRRDPLPRDESSPSAKDHRLNQLRTLFRTVHGSAVGPRLRFYTDSDELTAHYMDLTGCPFETLPVPHTRAASQFNPDVPDCFCVTYAGDARTEKGYHHLPRVVDALTRGRDRRGELCFQIQSHFPTKEGEPRAAKARMELEALAARGVHLLTSPLDSRTYAALLAQSQLVLLPYDAEAYRNRTSGIFVEALGAGVPVIVPADTWMARQLPPGAGLTFRHPMELPSLVEQVRADYPRFRSRAEFHARKWRGMHNAERLVERLQVAMQTSGNALASSNPTAWRHVGPAARSA